MSSKITISGLTVQAIIGVHRFEQQHPQTLVIDFSFSVNTQRAAMHDALSDTHDYAAICKSVMTFIENNPCRLLETLAERLKNYLENELHLCEIELTITKKPVDMLYLSGVSVSLNSTDISS